MKKWFDDLENEYYLFNDLGEKIKVEEDSFPHASMWFNEERNRAIAFSKMVRDNDPTAFGAAMSCAICDAVTMYNGEIKLLVFSTVNAAERIFFKRHDRNFKRKCLRRVDEFYSKKEYQIRIQFDEWEYDDHVLRPIVFIVSEDGEIEAIPTHRELSKMEIVPVKDCYSAVFFNEDGKMEVGWVLDRFHAEREIHDEDFDRWGTMPGATYPI